jgi:hypothetical protein
MRHLLTFTVLALLISSFSFAVEVETDVDSMQCNERTVINKGSSSQKQVSTSSSSSTTRK